LGKTITEAHSGEQTMGRMSELLEQAGSTRKRLLEHYPSETKSFLNFLHTTDAGAAISQRQKELINVALAVASQCDRCIAAHVKSAVSRGASRDEIVEAGFMAVIMHGGPAYMYMSSLFEALDEFLPEQE
jgi:AhpD family alkylhydroperoxidase